MQNAFSVLVLEFQAQNPVLDAADLDSKIEPP